MNKLSVVLATFNEEANIGDCLKSVSEIADETIIVDGRSSDKTVEIARALGAKVEVTDNHPIFHINKQKAIDLAKNEWILQLDADERVTPKLASEISRIIQMDERDLDSYQKKIKHRDLFLRHQKIIEHRDGKVGEESGEYAAFFIARLNYFLGGYLKYGGVYPDGVIRLIKKDMAYLPCQSVHEQMVVKGKVGWLENPLLHIDSPTFSRYLKRNSRYIDLIVDELKRDKAERGFLQGLEYFVFKPLHWFLLTQIRHKGILDGFRGVIFSFFSALRFPRAYWRYLHT